MTDERDMPNVPTATPRDLAGVAGDATTLLDVLRAFEAEGFGGQFTARDGGSIECLTCRTEMRADALELVHLRRLEGASDPADMLAIAALRCGACAAAGALVLNYGPEATAEDSAVLQALDDPPAPQPGDVT